MATLQTEKILLSTLKVAGIKPAKERNCAVNETASEPPAAPPPLASVEQPKLAAPRVNPYERLAADRPGEELAPDAGIWQLYVEEANEHDNELVKGKNDNLDVMLLFAALFSAILTAFLVDSKNMLQQDSADLTVTLLLAIAQSQQRLEQGTPQALPVIELPQFSASMSARWVNGLWFTALALSLAAALIAMLSKEWLTTFATSRSRSPRIYTLHHQKRLRGLADWRAWLIIDLLPSMLHLSFLLFSLGLAIHLWTLDSGIAIAEVVVAGLTFLFYVGTTVLGAVCDSCPFVTQISKSLRVALAPFFQTNKPSINAHGPSKREETETEAFYNNLQALSWLVENARDPNVSDCACQALAGLRLSAPNLGAPEAGGAPNAGTRVETHSPMIWSDHITGFWRVVSRFRLFTPNQDYRRSLVHNLFDQVCIRLCEAGTRQNRDLEVSKGLNVARYSGGLPALVQCLEIYPEDKTTATTKGMDWPAKDKTSANYAFSRLDSIWSIDHHEFSSDSYARLTAAELRLTEVVARTHRLKSGLPVRHSAQITHHPQLASPGLQDGLPLIDVESARIAISDEKIPLFELRARYSRALARTAILLFLHVNHCAPISPHSLAYLLDSVSHSAQCEDLNPASDMSTSLPQSEHGALPEFRVVLHGLGITRYLPPTSIGEEEGMVCGLVGLLSSPGIEQNTPVEIAAVHTLTILGPILFRQWLHATDKYLMHTPNKEAMNQGLANWPTDTYFDKLPFLPIWTLSQLLSVAAIAVSQAGNPDMAELPETAVSALYHRASVPAARGFLHIVAQINQDMVQMLLHYAGLNHAKLSQETLEQCLQIFLIGVLDQTSLVSQSISSTSLPTFLDLLAKIPAHPEEVRTIFADVQQLLRLDPGVDNYLAAFTHQSEGFVALGQIAALPEYTPVVVDFISEVFEVAADLIIKHPGESSYHPTRTSLPGLLHAMRLVVRSKPSGTDELAHLAPFMSNVTTLLNQIHNDDLIALVDSSVTTDIHTSLVHALKHEPALADVVDQWEKIWRLGTDGASPSRSPGTRDLPVLASEAAMGELDQQ
ncbi:hypothetical protein FS749_001717 [Ceratobasidium sp. UAMH 11750]|nr:hypothetical protein FS749_001717 [Ceratobasidium sp. UAMH 11750]